ncbi:MAG: Thermonuclease family protein [Microgenomates group bacterium GW2011_GWA2_40_6]|nr:MAG: Thermonuclease family protein [Microgenomates group bacterium GW2011_GWA2_40_6]
MVGVALTAGLGAGLMWNRVTEVVDGDTFKLANGQKVRMVGIDAPEMDKCGGMEAKKELEKNILYKKVELTDLKVDQYGRILALVYSQKKLVNQAMLKSGWARWDGTRNLLGETLGNADKEARDNKAGVFGMCRQPEKKECLVKGNIEKRSQGGEGGRKWYFFEGCSEYEAVIVEKELGEEWFCTEAEAVKAGYVKATNCFGKKAGE